MIPYSEVYLTGGANTYTIGRVTFEQDDPLRLLASPFVNPGAPNALYPVVSPDNRTVAYVVVGFGRGEIWIVDAQVGQDETKIYDLATDSPNLVPVQLCYTPDGATLLWSAVGPTIYQMAADGSGSVSAFYTDPSARNIGNIGFSADGTRIAFQVLLSATSKGNWVMDADGTNAAQVSTSPTQFSALYNNQNATPWASLQNTILYTGNTLAAPTARRVDDNGSNDTLLGSYTVALHSLMQAWSEDDAYVVYRTNSRNTLRRFNADGSGNALIHTAAGVGDDLGGYDESFHVIQDRLYFCNGEVMSIRWDGSDFRNHTYVAGTPHNMRFT